MMSYSSAVQLLGSFCAPVICNPFLIFPCLTIEVKGLSSAVESIRQNRHNGAVMLRNLRHLRLKAGMSEEKLREEFDQRTHVLSLSIAQDTMSIHCHWTGFQTGNLEYYSAHVKSLPLHEAKRWPDAVTFCRNAIDWVIRQNKTWIQEDLATIQTQIDAGSMPPPSSPAQSSRERSRSSDSSP
ncbi:hypothetical protein VTN77DRAFT_2038 [Rasamsonia byssochlamydoides]|uniref:uncharacterized protein n=1 Tax=Rasamsonia byssochlamydoides TaxID=89139 RepID=UPI00374403A0